MSFAPARTRPETVNRSTNESETETDMATMTATTTRQQLRGDYSLRERTGGVASKSSSSAFPTSQLPRNGSTKPNSSTWGLGNSSNADERDKSTWTGSWSKIQNIASTVLGSVGELDADDEERKRRIRIAERRRRAGLDTFNGGKSSGSNSSPASSASTLRSRVGGSTLGEGDGDLRTRGRRKAEEDESKLRRTPNIPTVTSTGISSRPLHKRTTSPDLIPPQNRASSSPPSTDRGEDTLAYIHKVRPTDTLEGVVIMYNIHPSALRRANRLWMGDSIQWRKELYLPVDECLVKGRPLTKKEEEQRELEEKQKQDKETTKPENKEPTLLGLSESELSGSNLTIGTRAGRKDHPPSIPDSIPDSIPETPAINYIHSHIHPPTTPPPSTSSTVNGILRPSDPPHLHHSYVLITGIGLVEICRLSRTKLSHFPPRKGPRGRGLSASSTTIPEDIGIGILDSNSSSSVFRPGGKVSEAYTGIAGPRIGTGGEIPGLGQMFGQVARETREGVENVGSFVEGFVRKVVVKVGEMARDGTEAAIELAEHVGSGSKGEGEGRGQGRGQGRGGSRERERGSTSSSGYGVGSVRERYDAGGGGGESSGVRGLRGRASLGSFDEGSDSLGAGSGS